MCGMVEAGGRGRRDVQHKGGQKKKPIADLNLGVGLFNKHDNGLDETGHTVGDLAAHAVRGGRGSRSMRGVRASG